MRPSRQWVRALAAHDDAVAEFVAEVRRVPHDRWRVPRAPGKWSPAQEVLHVAMSYEAGVAALEDGTSMQLRVTPGRARLLRWLLLPVIVHTGWFPHGAAAPREVRPPADVDASSLPEELIGRVERGASRVRAGAVAADRGFRFMHAYFGALPPLSAVRMLAAHTHHHRRALRRERRT